MGHKLPPDSIMVSACAHACGAAAQSVLVEQSQVNQEVISEDASFQGVFLCGGSDSLEGLEETLHSRFLSAVHVRSTEAPPTVKHQTEKTRSPQAR